MTKKPNISALLGLAFAFSLLMPLSALAGKAEIMLLPTRVVMKADERYASVQIKNTGDATGQFSVDLVDMTMQEDGRVTPLEEGKTEPFSAIPYLHLSPKSMTVPAGEAQSVRLMLKKGESLEPGEYRAHLRVRIENDNVDDQGEDMQTTPKDAVIAVKANLVLIIPVIIRVGETSYTIGIDDPKVKQEANGGKTLELFLTRDGNRSSMGDFTIKFKPANGGEETVLSFFPGVPVYRPTTRRFVSIPLDVPNGLSLDQGELDISYTAQEDEGGKILAQKTLSLK